MGEGLYGPWPLGPGLLERAVLDPHRRPVAIHRALESFVNSVPAEGTALIRPSLDGPSPWRIEYAGTAEEEMRRWLRDRLDESLEITTLALAKDAPCSLGTGPLVFTLHPQAPSAQGLWVVWPYAGLDPPGEETENFRKALETLVEVEHEEPLYFHGGADLPEELSLALRQGDQGALAALLDLTRQIGGADLAYWGNVHDNRVSVEWHRGTRDGGFGFELPLGQGVGGRAFAGDATFEILDYKNCRYRYPGVSDVTDGEEVRSTLAIPVHSANPQAGAVLYAGRRTVTPFSPAQRLLLSRLVHSIEPITEPEQAPDRFFIRDLERTKDLKSELRRVLLNSSQVQDIESWAEQLVRGPAVMVGPGGHPYVLGNLDRFERLRNASAAGHGSRVIPLTESGAGGRGHLYLWPSVDLPLSEWPDLIEDLAAACNVVVDRMEHAYDRLNHQRSHWIRGVLEGRKSPRSRREGNRLGLPTDRGEVWAVAWEAQSEPGQEEVRQKMLAEDVTLDLLDSPFIVLDENIGVLLLKKSAQRNPSFLRDELLKTFGPAPLWLVHGAVYDSFEGLEEALLQTVEAVRRTRQGDAGRYVSEVNGAGLDSLLENPRISEELFAFADNLLAPVLAYDEAHGTQLAETFCLSLLLGSTEEVSKRLYVHANTVRYRIRRAEQVLDRDLTLPKERVAANLASFVWLRRHADTRLTETCQAPGSFR